MKYTIDELTPNQGVTKAEMVNNGEYELYQVWQSDDLLKTLEELYRLIREYGQDSDYDLKIDGEPFLITKDNVLMFD